MNGFVIWNPQDGRVTTLDDRRAVGLTRDYCRWYGRRASVSERREIEERLRLELAFVARQFLRGREPTTEQLALIHELELAASGARPVVPVKLVRLDYHTPYRPTWDREEVWQPIDTEREHAERERRQMAVAG